ncbi:uncharacterized protein LOC115627249 [Scaptodrosophila lebanonensis]|uniref:Uncharacterized protein LOC115627249 n=1 Tax=Drosophila lebanonensis TaxID=7225 RepID=A0A6J2TT32_DROLE|nr:uncharacterized protein LOC115627249 [Scaptodrosophila lebanonensis]
MCKGLGFSTGFMALCAFIACFGALNMLSKIEHIIVNPLFNLPAFEPVDDGDDEAVGTCKSYIVDNIEGPYPRFLELTYMRWTVGFTLFYSFAVMLLVRAKYVSNMEIKLIIASLMMFVGAALALALFASTTVLSERPLFAEVRCNEYTFYFIFFIALNTSMCALYFLTLACYSYFNITDREL